MPSTQIYQDSTILFIYALTSHVYWNILKQMSDTTECYPYVLQHASWHFWDFPGGPEVKNLFSKAGDVGLIPGWGTKIPHAPKTKLTGHN